MRFILALILTLALAAPAMAAKSETETAPAQGGFEGPVRRAPAETVEKALTLAHDARVTLNGNLVESVEGERNLYIFKDASGEMPVVITPKQFSQLPNKITPAMKLSIGGKIIKDANAPDPVRLRVTRIEVVK